MSHSCDLPATSETQNGEANKGRPLLVTLLPARNAAADLPGYLENVARFSDAVVALDDGSTDDTFDVLAAHPLVKILLRNPRREDYRGWDDAANRNRLIDAAADLDPQWLISLDADERFDEVDAVALREFLQTDAVPGLAYGFRHVPMREDEGHFLPRYWWAYRLFSAAPGQRFPISRLHFVPIPTSIPRHRWVKTSLRIKHLGELTAERRLTRFGKYLEADPDRRYESFYAECLATRSAEELGRWLPRPPSMPVILGDAAPEDIDDPEAGFGQSAPTVSAIIIDSRGEASIYRTIHSVLEQVFEGSIDVIVVTPAGSETVRNVRDAFPSVNVVPLPATVTPGRARNQGLIAAQGHIATFLTPDVELPAGSIAARVEAHRRGCAIVTGTVVKGTTTPAGWASYFLEHGTAFPGLPAEQTIDAGAHGSYTRMPLIEVGGFPESVNLGEEIFANQAIFDRGYTAFRDPRIQVIEHGPRTVFGLLARQFARGRGHGRLVLAQHRYHGGLLREPGLLPSIIRAAPGRLRQLDARVADTSRDLQDVYRRHRRLVAVGAFATVAGEWWEILRPEPGKLAMLLGSPVRDILVGGRGRLALAQLDAVSSRITVWPVPADIKVSVDRKQVSLAEILSLDDTSGARRSLPDVRRAAAEALDVDHLECLVDSRLCLPARSTSADTDERARPLWRALPRQVADTVRTAFEIRRNTLRSTLNPWTTARALRHLGRISAAAEGQ